MEPQVELAAQQLRRMRGMNAAYHQRFFSDIRFSTALILALFVGGWTVHRSFFLIVPFIALMGACQTAFDASYLIFSRQYATTLEAFLNQQLGHKILVAHLLEDAYLFPLDQRKVVTLAGGGGFTWFGFMTAFYTLTGFGAYLFGLWVGIEAINTTGQLVAYWAFLGGLTLTAAAVGTWWFVGGQGERRLRTILDNDFGTATS